MLQLLGITKHLYYYKPKPGKGGRKPSATTVMLQQDGSKANVPNEQIAEEIGRIKSNPETDYGYRAMTAALMLLGYIINHKKVYRIMGIYQFLHERVKRPIRKYAKYRRVNPTMPLEVIEMDIKFQWVQKHCRYAFILTILDCFTRKVLYWTVAYSIKHQQVIKSWGHVIVNYLQPHEMLSKNITIEARNDNDARFASKIVQQYMKDNHLNQVFTHPYTPEENGHVESFHSILGRSLAREEYATIIDLEAHLVHFYKTYNEVRLHGSLDHLAPDIFWKLWEEGYIISTSSKNKPLKHKLTIPHYQLSGNGSLREVSGSLEERKNDQVQKELHPTALDQSSVQKSPSVVSGTTKLVSLKNNLLTQS